MRHISTEIERIIQPIETSYAGCLFRSRLEARYAVLFDELGCEWEYEPQGFELESGKYLPDFFLPEYNRWVEIKGKPIQLSACSVYLAGRMTKWRDCMFGEAWKMTAKEQFRPFYMDGFLYQGPYISGCVGCHGSCSAKHGNVCENCGEIVDMYTDVSARSLRQIDVSDYVFAWIDSAESFGSLVEIGYAKAQKKRLFVALSERVAEDAMGDLWFAESLTSYPVNKKGYATVNEAFEAFRKAIRPPVVPPEIEKCLDLSKATGKWTLLLAGGIQEAAFAQQSFLADTDGTVRLMKNGELWRSGSIAIGKAIKAARSARFEHRQSGAML